MCLLCLRMTRSPGWWEKKKNRENGKRGDQEIGNRRRVAGGHGEEVEQQWCKGGRAYKFEKKTSEKLNLMEFK